MATQIVVKDLQQAFDQARDLDGSMNERLDVFAGAVRTQNPAGAAIVDRLVSRLREHSAGDMAPKPGDVMPPFILPDEGGHLVSLKDLLAQGPAVVTFHRGHWCPYCRLNTAALADAHEQAARDGGQIVAITPDRQKFALALQEDSGAAFPILTDMDNGYAMSLNLAIWVGGEMEEYMTGIGRSLPVYQGNESWMLPIPATFVVGRDGRIKARFVDPDYRKRMAVDELIEALT